MSDVRTIRLHTSLYPEAVVREAIAVFADFGTFETTTSDDGIEVRLTPGAGVDPGELVGEFGNTALSLAIQSQTTDVSGP